MPGRGQGAHADLGVEVLRRLEGKRAAQGGRYRSPSSFTYRSVVWAPPASSLEGVSPPPHPDERFAHPGRTDSYRCPTVASLPAVGCRAGRPPARVPASPAGSVPPTWQDTPWGMALP
ncbi:hypothetical protein Sros01_71720 [Streptomyces roseochromogenus]|nr:hypothetical protein Sros01_71720 [Streptomyces roseochromogenus]